MINSPTNKHRSLQKAPNSSEPQLASSTVSHRDIPTSPKSSSKALKRDISPPGLSSSVVLPNCASMKFNKSERFPPLRPFVGEPKYYLAPSSFSLKKGPSMGFGERSDIVTQKNKDSKNYPSPIDYPLKSDFDQSPTEKKGKSFGLSHAVYEKAYVPGYKNLSLSVAKEIPGPGAYQVEQKDVVAGMGKVHFLPRGKMFNEGLGLGSPNSNHYSPKTEIIMSGRFRGIGFGFGKKYDFTKKKDYVPGPADYNPNIFKENFSRRDVSPKVGRS